MSDDLSAKLASLRRKCDGLQETIRLNDIGQEVNTLDATIAGMPTEIEAVRKQGYAFRSYLEHKATVFQKHWDEQRLMFEQKEKVGKKLGLFGGKQVQELEWEVPSHRVEAVEFENKCLFGGKDMLHFLSVVGDPYPRITVEIKGGADNKFWVKQINRMISGAITDERAIEPDPEILQTLREAPGECHVCGATIPMLVAGQTQLECDILRICYSHLRLDICSYGAARHCRAIF
ncbi:MAG: hypothetical protein ACOCX5_03405 [Chloroflexota bacterium]